MGALETLVVERRDGVVTLTMNRPERKNAVTAEMTEELIATLREVQERPEDRVLVLTGAAGEFCSGADLSDVGESMGRSPLFYMRRISELALTLHRLPKPTIARVAGVAAGMGANLALGCDLILAGEGARFSEIFARRGLSVDCGGSWLLPRLVGLHRAKELAFFAEVIPASDAEGLGLVNRVVPDDQLDAVVDQWATRLAAGPPLALSMTKTLLNNSLTTSLDQALEDEARCQAVNFSTADVAEAMRAFVEKRDPHFSGR
ncbi:MAG: enoyl-CoA hydratase/isomerase family protein [Acidimicrobiales bacterium]